MGEHGREAPKAKLAVLGGALLLIPLAVPPIVRRLDHRRDAGAAPLGGEGLDLEHHQIPSKDGTPLHLTVTGHGEKTLFLVHGWTCNESVFRYQQRRFSDGYRVVTLELRGHGASGMPSGLDFGHERFAEDLRAAIDYIDPAEYAIGGFSMGGFTALKFYEAHGSEHAGRLKGMVLIDSSGLDLAEGIVFGSIWKRLYPFPLSFILPVLGRPSRFKDRMMELFKNTSMAYLVTRLMAFGRRPSGVHVEHQREMSFSTRFSTACLSVKSMLDYHVEDCLPDIKVPVLLLMGEHDKLTNISANTRTAAMLPDARLKIFPGAGHDSLMERSDEFNDEMASFLDEAFDR
jgi:pimeloyl-ACP methyl ester carboxylesterase